MKAISRALRITTRKHVEKRGAVRAASTSTAYVPIGGTAMTELSNYVDALGHRIPVHCFENEPGPLPLSAEDLARFYEEVAAEEFA